MIGQEVAESIMLLVNVCEQLNEGMMENSSLILSLRDEIETLKERIKELEGVCTEVDTMKKKNFMV